MKNRIAAAMGVLGLAVLLGGCVLAVGNTPGDKDMGKRMKALEDRLAALEKNCGACPMGSIQIEGMDNASAGVIKLGAMKMGTMNMGNGKIIVVGQDGKPMELKLDSGTVMIREEDEKEGEEKEGDEKDEDDERGENDENDEKDEK